MRASYFLDQIRSASVVVQRAGLVLFDPDADQVTRKVVALGQPVKRLATQKLWATWRLNLMLWDRGLGMGVSPKARPPGQSNSGLLRHQGPTPLFSVQH
jgi:hypothetical protein